MQKTFSLYTFALVTLGQSDGAEETGVFTAIVFDSLRKKLQLASIALFSDYSSCQQKILNPSAVKSNRWKSQGM